MDTVTVELPKSVWSAILADLNVYRMEAENEFAILAKNSLRRSAEVSRQVRDASGDEGFGRFADRDVDTVEKPYEMQGRRQRSGRAD